MDSNTSEIASEDPSTSGKDGAITSGTHPAPQPALPATPVPQQSLPDVGLSQLSMSPVGHEVQAELHVEKQRASPVSNAGPSTETPTHHLEDPELHAIASTEIDILQTSQEDQVESETNEGTSFPDIEIDSDPQDNSDADSALGSTAASSTVSLRDSIFAYVEENGRTYHAFNAGKYIGPNDEIEQARLDLQHHLFLITLGNKLHLAPLQNPQNVLDIATGTGIWAIEFAEQYPSANVLGTDLSPIQPVLVPPNCRFEIDDAEDEWIYSHQFDYIHGRALVSCFRNPPSVIASIFGQLTPGGYFEFQDPIMPLRSVDDSLAGTALDEFQTCCMEAAERLGRPWTNGKNYGRWMREAGFEDVVEKSYYWATNHWVRGKTQKVQAMWLQQNLWDGLPAWGLSTLSRGLGWSRERIEILIARARNDLKNPNIHAYAECYVAYGRKPSY